jgi:thioredoxin 1
MALDDKELEEIRRRKMELMMQRAQQKEKQKQVSEPYATGAVSELTEFNFWQVIQKTNLAVVDFYGAWCQPCKMLAPILAELARDYKGKVFFGRIDIDRNPRVTAQFNVQSVPMVVIFQNGKPAGMLPGLRSYNEYDMLIERLIADQKSGPSGPSYIQ